MADLTAAYNALLSIREQVQDEQKWIDGMLENYARMPSNALFDHVTHHLITIKTLLSAQDAIITMQMRYIEQDVDSVQEVKKRLGL